MNRRVVITGLGAVTALGEDVRSLWEAVVAGRSGVRRIQSFDPSGLKTQVAAEVLEFDPARYMNRKDVRRLDRSIQFAVNAAGQAIEDAGLLTDSLDRTRVGVIIGSGIGGIHSLVKSHQVLETEGPDRISPFFVPACLADMSAGYVSIQYGFGGPNMAIVTACASGNNAIGEAMRMIRLGLVDVMIAGGTEAAILPLTIAGFDQMGALACSFNDAPERACRPFDRDRAGFVLGEGAGVLVLEALEHAQARGARVYAELVGYGATSDAYHIAAPDPSAQGAIRALRLALEDAGLAPEDVDYINAHGTGTDLNDAMETTAIRQAFGPAADRLMVSSTKAVTGHLLGAAGAVEAIISCLALYHGIVPPTINLDNPDPRCDLDYVPWRARQVPLRAVVSNSFGFGGHNACLVFRHYA
ncbi:MAG: beta-ketoacyl-ACP synthase II [Anaerolineae bacterium]|nr:beta-ketoacyl-ACP synthase II [Anaerolineae bacterium]